MSHTSFVLGLDGGGARSTGLIADLSGNVLTRHEAGGTNPNVVGFDKSAKTLHRLISKCCKEARCTPEELSSVVLGVAGARVLEFRQKIRDKVNAEFERVGTRPLQLTIETDARIALEGAFDGGPGVVVIAGTGSIIIGKTQRGDVISVGGWGRILGDEGSGFAIGREGVRALIANYDGRGEPTQLQAILEDRFGWKLREDIIRAVYQGEFDLATVSPMVLESAANRDIVCQKILKNAASELVDQLRIIVLKMGFLRKVSVVLTGGIVGKKSSSVENVESTAAG